MPSCAYHHRSTIKKASPWLLCFFLFSTGAALAQIRAGQSFSTLPSDGSNGLGQTRNINHLYIYALNNGCASVEIASLNYQVSLALRKDSLYLITLPHWPQIFDTIFNNTLEVKSNVPINVYQGSNTLDLRPILRGTLNDTLRNRHLSSIALALNDNKFFDNNYFQFFSVPQGNLNYELNIHGPTYGIAGLDYYALSLEDANSMESYFNCYLLDGTSQSPKDTILFSLNQREGNYFGLLGGHSNGQFGGLDWPSESYTLSLNAKPFKSFVHSAVGIANYGYTLGFNAQGVVLMLLEDTVPLFTFLELKPESALESAYHFPAFLSYAGQCISLQALADSTDIFLNGAFLKRLDRAKRFDTLFTEDISISATYPISAIVHPMPDSLGNYTPPNGVARSSFALQANGDQELIKHSRVPTLHQNADIINILSIVCRSADTASLSINNNPPAGSWQTFVGDPSWSYLNETVGLGVHDVQNPQGFHGYFYTSADYQPDTISANYAFVLTEYSPWPVDSFKAYLGASAQNLKAFSTWRDSGTIFCPGDTLYLKPPALRHTTWQWLINDSLALVQPVEENAGGVVALVVPNWLSFELKLQDQEACEVPQTTQVKVRAFDDPEIFYRAESTCSGQKVELQLENPLANETITWQIEDQIKEGAAVVFNLNQAADSLQFELTREIEGCSYSLSFRKNLDPLDPDAQLIPNVLSPNGDGQNDVWCFENWAGFENCFAIEIANRWGRSVFSSSDPNSCWAPKREDSGVYYYTLQLGNTQKKGFITLF
jgi:gliding motility-associated-like protein